MHSHDPANDLELGEQTRLVYAPVSPVKFCVLYVVTFGVYGLVWFYRNWRYVKTRDQSNISPFWRSVFALIWYFALIIDIREETDEWSSGALAAAWFLFTGVGRLPDPYWLLWFLSFLPLLPTVLAINRLNRAAGAAPPKYSQWRYRNVPLVAVGAIALLLVAAMAFQLVPSSRVQTGAEIPGRYISHLREVDLIGDGDTVLYFYSDATFSMRRNGTVLTNRGLGSYWIDDATGELQQFFIAYEGITGVEADWSDSWLGETAVHIIVGDTLMLSFGLSTEARRDSAFVQELERRSFPPLVPFFPQKADP